MEKHKKRWKSVYFFIYFLRPFFTIKKMTITEMIFFFFLINDMCLRVYGFPDVVMTKKKKKSINFDYSCG